MRGRDPASPGPTRVRKWRITFAAYALALTVGTHWPKLQIDAGGVPAPDKVVHFLAFGGLAMLLWRTGWIATPWALFGVATAWALLDELTQAIPILGRTFSWLDVLAGWLGVLAAVVWACIERAHQKETAASLRGAGRGVR